MLDDHESRAITLGGQSAQLFVGNGPLALEVVEVPLGARPQITDLRSLFRDWMGGRAAPVSVVAPWDAVQATVYGPTEKHPIAQINLPTGQIEAACSHRLAPTAPPPGKPEGRAKFSAWFGGHGG